MVALSILPSMSADEAGQIFEKNLFGWKEEGDDDDSPIFSTKPLSKKKLL